MATSLVFVSGTTRINLNERVGLFLQAGYYPLVDINAKTVTETVKVQLRWFQSTPPRRRRQRWGSDRSRDPDKRRQRDGKHDPG